MEKIVCALWRTDGEARDTFNARLVTDLPQGLRNVGAHRVRINVRDANIEPAHALIQQWQDPQQDAVVQFWLDSANAMYRGEIEAALARHCGRFAGWLVTESTIIANHVHLPEPGARTAGWSQASFISFRTGMPREAAIAHWHGHHTRVAIETQSNFEYVQNLIVMPLSEDAPSYDAFVEECFPAEAMDNPAAFFDAVGDQAKCDANVAAMTESCAAFIDFARIDIIPTSQFDFRQQAVEAAT